MKEAELTLAISAESPTTPDGIALIEGSQAALLEVFSPEEIFTFSPQELAGDDIAFLVARRGTAAVGCVALVDCGDYGEIKRLYVSPAGRGFGVARALMAELEVRARSGGLRLLRLETGAALEPAVALYRRLGYCECGRFGTYDDHPASLFMEKRL
ncbi:MAG: GNAT family N-acetyltransferase [Rhodobacteraceae bacterium]|nr:GNAT family N-acetyltransferase [Paracoccaceae bacterium]